LNRSHVTRYEDALRRTLGWRNLTALGRTTRHCRRLRDVTPQRLVCSLMEALGSLRVQTVADILRLFNAQTGLNTQYKALYNRLAQPEFPRFMRQVFRDILKNLSVNVLRPAVGGKLTHFKDVVVQDGSSFAVHDELRRTFGGRFTTTRPAAVEIHTFVSVFRDQVIDAEVAPDKDPERKFLPSARSLTGKLLLADRGYQSLDYWEEVDAAGGGGHPLLRRRQRGVPVREVVGGRRDGESERSRRHLIHPYNFSDRGFMTQYAVTATRCTTSLPPEMRLVTSEEGL